jgi:hypothetical protein
VKRRKPPHLRRAASHGKSCHTCASMNRRNGICARYNFAVKRTETCDTWRSRRTGQR